MTFTDEAESAEAMRVIAFQFKNPQAWKFYCGMGPRWQAAYVKRLREQREINSPLTVDQIDAIFNHKWPEMKL